MTARQMARKIIRRMRWLVLFHVVGMYENSAMVAAIMMIDEMAPPRPAAESDSAVVGFRERA